MANPKLHQIVAVVKDLDTKAVKGLEAFVSLVGTKNRYMGVDTTYEVVTDPEQNDQRPPEHQRMQGILADDIANVVKVWADAVDVSYQVEQNNLKTSADIVVDGQLILTGLSVGALMNLKHALEAMLTAAKALPTLDLTEEWNLDSKQAGRIWKSNTIWSWYTKKTFVPLVLDPGNDKHAAQVKEGWEDKNVGKRFITKQSSAITPAEKALIVGRIEKIILGTKDAIERANSIEADTSKISDKLLAYLQLGN